MVTFNSSLLMDLAGTTLSSLESEMLQHPLIAGIVLFKRNFTSYTQLVSLCKSIRAATNNKPLLITVDQEGGRVQRFKQEFTLLPSLQTFGQLYQQNTQAALVLVSDIAWLMATELLAAGVDLSFSPVLDLNQGLNTVIGDRAFHSDPSIVARLAQSYVAGLQKAGMAGVGKHFPGHGSIAVDTHHGIGEDARSWDVIKQQDLVPFQALIKCNIPALMTAHIIFSAIDRLPVTFSRLWLQDILRSDLNYQGTIFSDDLNMAGTNMITQPADKYIAAKEAGCDFILYCNNSGAVIEILDNIVCNDKLHPNHKIHTLLAKNTGVEAKSFPRWHEIKTKLDSFS